METDEAGRCGLRSVEMGMSLDDGFDGANSDAIEKRLWDDFVVVVGSSRDEAVEDDAIEVKAQISSMFLQNCRHCRTRRTTRCQDKLAMTIICR